MLYRSITVKSRKNRWIVCADLCALPATITLQKLAQEAARRLLLGFHVLSGKGIRGYQAMDNLPQPLRHRSKLGSLPCPIPGLKSTLAAFRGKWYPQPSRAGWGQEVSAPVSSVREEGRQTNQRLLHHPSVLLLQMQVALAKGCHRPRTLAEVL